VSKWAWAA